MATPVSPRMPVKVRSKPGDFPSPDYPDTDSAHVVGKPGVYSRVSDSRGYTVKAGKATRSRLGRLKIR